MLALKFSWKRPILLLLILFSEVFFSDAAFGKIKMVTMYSSGSPYYVPSESAVYCSEGGIYVEGVSVLKPQSCSYTEYGLTITDGQFLQRIRSSCDRKKSCLPISEPFYYNICGRFPNQPLQEFEISYICIYSHINLPTDTDDENELCSREKGGNAILVREVYIHKAVACQSDQGGFYLKDKQLAQYQLACNGKSRCDYRYAPPFTCHAYSDTHAVVPDKIEVFYTCLPVEPDGDKVFSMTENFTTTRHRAVTHETTMLVMEASAGMLTERQCVASGTNVRLTMKVLQLDIGQTANRGACTGWFKSSTTNSVTSDKEIRCSDLETIDDFDKMTLLVSSEKSYIKVQVSMTSGLVWLQFTANQAYTLRCEPLSEKVVDGPVVTGGPFPLEESTSKRILSETRKTTAPKSSTRKTTAPVKEGGQEGTNSDDDGDDNNSINMKLLIIIVISVVAVVAIIIAITLCSLFFCYRNSPLQRWTSRRRQRRQQQQENQLQQINNKVQDEYAYVDENQLTKQESCHTRLVPEFHASINNTTVSYSNTANASDRADEDDYMEIPESPHSPATRNTSAQDIAKYSSANTLPMSLRRKLSPDVPVSGPERAEAVYSVVFKGKEKSSAQEGHYSDTSQSRSTTTRATYDTMLSVEGEYSHLKRPGDEQKVIDNVYDG